MKNELHQKVYNFLEAYRAKNPNFLYIQRATNKKERLTKGFWFQGQEKYASVGLYDKNGGMNMTKSFCLVFYPNDKGGIGVVLEIILKGEKDQAVLDFYKKAIELTPGTEPVNKQKLKYKKYLSDGDGLGAARVFLDTYRTKLNDLAKQEGVSHIFISRAKFEKLHKRARAYMVEHIWLEKEKLFKVSMGTFNQKEVEECIQGKRIIVHGETKAKGISSITQDELFSEGMEIGDYFYLTHSNGEGALKLIGRITSEAKLTDYNGEGEHGWLERTFELVKEAQSTIKYSGENKRWAPSNFSTCIEIKELDIANRELFEPFFLTRFKRKKEDLNDKIMPEFDTNLDFEYPLNQILFGPPGTGKTYHTINYALAIIAGVENQDIIDIEENYTIEKAKQYFPDFDFDSDFEEGREFIRAIYQHYYELGQIVFTTFHQSMSYEDFIEGIKPLRPENKEDNLNYDVQKGIFGALAFKAQQTKTKKYNIDEDEGELTRALFESFYESFSEKLANTDTTSNCTLKTKTGKPFSLFKNSKGSIMVKPGEDGTFMNISCNELKRVFFDKTKPHYSSYEYILIDKILEGKNYQEEDINNNQKNFVLIIDEINRGNVSEIFGELITLIEEDKRLGREEALEVELPYSKEKFAVPSNLYILGTMNTADRSVEALDTALRRRFSFVEMPPKKELLKEKEIEGIKLDDLLECINKRIEKLLTKDHLIGHSYLMNIENIEGLKSAFRNKILPLLQEYFYGDFGKIGLVLGKGFIEKEDDVDFADFDYGSGGYESRDTFKISEIDDEFDIITALRFLMNQGSNNEE
ncbi:MAG: 5-methylcytosine-specific restriction protein B [uncultured Sulfurovum sp.]|uniref:5-methylcytosine-specific restriction protein B n=1 Tax=uncultured Sulfurovum sp. TaxID=269237 RepID=A0A6S6U3G4_9BACT|nr:MAG: 5-methylcytosine-specific restriction protein B [uncultured Sulfurovum sp.]